MDGLTILSNSLKRFDGLVVCSIYKDGSFHVASSNQDAKISMLASEGLDQPILQIVNEARVGETKRRCFINEDISQQFINILPASIKSVCVYFIKLDERVDLVFFSSKSCDPGYHLNNIEIYDQTVIDIRYELYCVLINNSRAKFNRKPSISWECRKRGSVVIAVLLDINGKVIKLTDKQKNRLLLLKKGYTLTQVSKLEQVSYDTIVDCMSKLKSKGGFCSHGKIIDNLVLV